MQRHKSQCSRENVALSSGTLFGIFRLSLGILTLIPSDRQVIKTTPARVWSCARQPIIKSCFILTIKTVTSA